MLIFALLAIVTLIGCDNGPRPIIQTPKGQVTFSLNLTARNRGISDISKVQIIGTIGNSEKYNEPFVYTGQANLTCQIPVGNGYIFTVNLRDNTNKVLFTGKSSATNVTTEQNASVVMTLEPPTTDVDVGGVIHEPVILPIVSIAAKSFTEGNTTNTVKIPVTLNKAGTSVVTVKYTTSDVTTTAGTDYTAATGTLTFPAGTTSQDISVSIKGDTTVEGNETFKITLTEPAGATLGAASAIITLTNDDVAPPALPIISIADASFSEGDNDNEVTVNVTLDKTTTKDVTVYCDFADITAKEWTDYYSWASYLTIAAGTTSQKITITIEGNIISESNKTFKITLNNPTNATIGRAEATMTITNDDTKPLTFSVTSCPNIGEFTNLIGQCYGLNPTDYHVIVYIQVNNWWIKPYTGWPLTTIGGNGVWNCDVTTGGVDSTATKFVAFLVPATYTSPPLSLGGAYPQDAADHAVLTITIDRTQTITLPITVTQ